MGYSEVIPISYSYVRGFSLKLLGYFSLLWFFFLPAVRAQVSPHYEQPIATPLRIVSLPDSVFTFLTKIRRLLK